MENFLGFLATPLDRRNALLGAKGEEWKKKLE